MCSLDITVFKLASITSFGCINRELHFGKNLTIFELFIDLGIFEKLDFYSTLLYVQVMVEI